jgi:hypothetical protein
MTYESPFANVNVIDHFYDDLNKLVDMYGNVMSFARFKREATAAWERKYPKKITKFQEFVKDNITVVRDQNPTFSHSDHMKLLGHEWKKMKAITGYKRREEDM